MLFKHYSQTLYNDPHLELPEAGVLAADEEVRGGGGAGDGGRGRDHVQAGVTAV